MDNDEKRRRGISHTIRVPYFTPEQRKLIHDHCMANQPGSKKPYSSKDKSNKD